MSQELLNAMSMLPDKLLMECEAARENGMILKPKRGIPAFIETLGCAALIVVALGAIMLMPQFLRHNPSVGVDGTSTKETSGHETTIDTEATETTDETTNSDDTEKRPTDLISELSRHESVSEIVPFVYEGPWSEYPAYQIKFVSDGNSMNFHLVLPIDAAPGTPLVFYFPEYGHSKEDLPAKFAANGFAVAMLKIRGDTSNAGIHDYGGKDFIDVLTLYDMMTSTHQFADSPYISMGVSNSSVRALRLAAEKGDAITACFVANPFTDIKALGEDFLKYCSGVTYQEAPEEYERRSAITFADRLVSPVYMIAFPQYLHFQSQHDGFVKAMADAGRELHVSLYENVPFNFTIELMKDIVPLMQKAVGMNAIEEAYPPQDLPSKEAFTLEMPSDELLLRYIEESEAYQRRDSHYNPKYQYPFNIERYYGCFGDVVFVYRGGGGLAYTLAEWTDSVAGYKYHYSDGNSIYVWAYGTFMTMEDAYEQGIITKEQVAVIYGEGKFIKLGAGKTFAALRRKIEADYAKSGENDTISRFYGIFDGCVPVMFNQPEQGAISQEKVAGQTFNYNGGNTIKVWKDGNFYSLTEAYAQGLMRKECFEQLAMEHRGGSYIQYDR